MTEVFANSADFKAHPEFDGMLARWAGLSRKRARGISMMDNFVIWRRFMREQKQQGFTLIELVVVIVILGILAAIAIPKYVNLQNSARTSVVYGTQGAVQGAAALAKAAWLAAGGTAAITTVTMDGQAVNVNTSGYPTAEAAGIGAAINHSTNIFLGTDAAVPATGTFTISYSSDGGATALANCNVLYTAGTSGTTSTDVTGC